MANRRPQVLALALALGAVMLMASVQEATAIACSPYVHPCNCGLCPHIVDCNKKQTAECYCGRSGVKPGIYRHPSDKTKFWMCSVSGTIKYGLEMACPQSPIPFVFNATTKACSVPTTGSNASKTPAPAAAPVAPKASPKPAVPKASPQPAVAATVSRVSSGKMLA